MFSRFRMNPIVEIQGSDWDRLRLIVAPAMLQCMRWRVKRKSLQTPVAEACQKLRVSYQHTVQDRRQLPPLGSASSLVTTGELNSQRERHWNFSYFLGLTMQDGTYRSCKGWPLFCLSSLVLLHCSPVQSHKTHGLRLATFTFTTPVSRMSRKQAADQDETKANS